MAIHFHDNYQPIKGVEKRKLSSYLTTTIHDYLDGIKHINLSFVFCDDAYLLEINKQYLNHDTYTDIITFDLSEGDTELVGEIYISTERVQENAQKYGVNVKVELHRVIFHGVLHLCGFLDKKPADKQEMTRAEDACLKAYLGV